MDNKTLGVTLIVIAVLALVIAQLIIKSRLTEHGEIPFVAGPFALYVLKLMLDWRMWLGLVGLISASLLWYAAVSRIPLSLAYPLGALSYPLVFVGSVLLLREDFSWSAVAGNALIVGGVILLASGRVD